MFTCIISYKKSKFSSFIHPNTYIYNMLYTCMYIISIIDTNSLSHSLTHTHIILILYTHKYTTTHTNTQSHMHTALDRAVGWTQGQGS